MGLNVPLTHQIMSYRDGETKKIYETMNGINRGRNIGRGQRQLFFLISSLQPVLFYWQIDVYVIVFFWTQLGRPKAVSGLIACQIRQIPYKLKFYCYECNLCVNVYFTWLDGWSGKMMFYLQLIIKDAYFIKTSSVFNKYTLLCLTCNF